MHTSNYGYNGVPSVSRYAAAFHKQGSRLHLGVFGMLAAEPRGAATYLGRDKGAQGPGYFADTYHVGKNSSSHLQSHPPLFLSTMNLNFTSKNTN